MAGGSKRKRNAGPSSRSDSDASDFEEASLQGSDDEIDITSALTGTKGKKAGSDLENDDFDELEDIIKQSVAKRDMKEGTKLLKKTKGKTSFAKGEVGGGSFQSMGMCSMCSIY
jgi:ATP-dependent RNA helicase DDX54/DBP10